jgi:hypothetical protein
LKRFERAGLREPILVIVFLLAVGLIVGPTVAGTWVLLWQVLTWLKTGAWVAMPTSVFWSWCCRGTQADSWVQSPSSWYGLHDIVISLLDLPLPIMGVAVSFLLLVIGVLLLGQYDSYVLAKHRMEKPKHE